jgi:hypothetical protein
MLTPRLVRCYTNLAGIRIGSDRKSGIEHDGGERAHHLSGVSGIGL